MTAYYLDTSALVKRYVHESGSPWVETLYTSKQNHELYTVQLTGAEFVAALYRRLRDKSLSKPMTTRLNNRFRTDWTTRYSIVAVDDALINQAMSLIENIYCVVMMLYTWQRPSPYINSTYKRSYHP